MAEVLDGPGWQKTSIPRENAMRPPIQFLVYNGDSDTDILQEYFIPLKQFRYFSEQMHAVLRQYEVNLLSMTTR